MGSDELAETRHEIAEIDRQIVDLAARRGELAGRLGVLKRQSGAPIRDYAYEKVVVERARGLAQAAGLSGDLAERLMLELIQSSLLVQEQDQVQESSAGSGRSALVVGGSGQMGQWFVRFMRSQGYAVTIADPRGSDADQMTWDATDDSYDITVIAAPLKVTADILGEMAQHPPEGVVIDIGSLKSPLRSALTALTDAGGAVASIHPMFGPETKLLSGRHVVVIDLGVERATAAARALFASTMVSVVEMDLDSHDRLIAYILGLSHALNIAFFTALAGSGETAVRLADLSSTTFDRQLAVANQVAKENPNLYFEIQSLNDYGKESLAALGEAVEKLRTVVEKGDLDGFTALMESGAAYFEQTGLG